MTQSAYFAGGTNPLPKPEPVFIARNAQIGIGVSIGPCSIVGREDAEPVAIGDHALLGEGVLVEPGARIGARAVIGDGCVIGGECGIADGTRLAAGLRVGTASSSLRYGDSHLPMAPAGARRTSNPISPHAIVASNIVVGEGVEIGPFAVVGWDGEEPVRIGARTKIAPYALIEPGATIGFDCDIDAYCRIGFGSTVGDETKLLYGAAVFEHVSIGRACIVGGDVADRSVLEDFVTYFGEIAHDYRHPGDLADWDGKPAKSPIIRTRSIVAQNAIIVGGCVIGPSSYVAAGEIVRVDVPEGMLFQRGKMVEVAKTRGLVRTRRDGLNP